MKKILSLILAIVMMFSLATAAFAANPQDRFQIQSGPGPGKNLGPCRIFYGWSDSQFRAHIAVYEILPDCSVFNYGPFLCSHAFGIEQL